MATQLARELARLGKPTVLVDAHLGRPHLSERLASACRGSIVDVLGGSRAALEVLEQIGDGVHLLPATRQTYVPADLSHAAVSRLLSEIRGLGSRAELAIVDAGEGMSPWVQRWWRAAQQVFVVTTTAEHAIKRGYVTMKLAPWGDADGKVRLVVNQCDDPTAAAGVAHRFARTCRRFLGLEIEAAPAIACWHEPVEGHSGRNDAFSQSVRLLATEVLSASVLVAGRIARQGNGRRRIAELLALPDFSLNSANNSQPTAQE